MEFIELSDDIAAAGQVSPADMVNVAHAGFRSIICNRPDGEAPDQPHWHDIETAAHQAGLETRYIPVGGAVSVEDQADAFKAAVEAMPKPILAFCRTGNRSTQLFRSLEK